MVLKPMSDGTALHEAVQVIECQVVEAGSQLSVALEDESQQPWEHSPTHTTPTHLLPTQMLHSAWHAVTPHVTIVLLLDAKLQDLAMHMTAVAAEKYLSSQLMPLNVESVHENVYFRVSLGQKEHVNWHIHSPATMQPCVCCECL